MSQKRLKQDGANPSPEEEQLRKRPSFRNAVLEVMKFCTIHKYVEPVLEPLIRKVVKEEVELALEKHIANIKWDCENEIDSSVSRSLRLEFLTGLSFPVFTGTRIEGVDCNTLKVALIDSYTGKTVSNGVESSAKVEIVVLEGDFDDDSVENWTLEEFNANVVRQRRGKKPLLYGNTFLNLEQGIGIVGNLLFTDNSSWKRSRKFRLGARVLDNLDGTIRVREAKSESFVVRDHRGESYKKHHPPYPCDEVWRLEKISKDGAFHRRLNKENVKTVKDFLLLFFVDPERLRHILGSGMSAKMWEVTVEHATRCVIDDNKLYLYRPRSQKRDGVVFNVVGQILGLLSDGKYVFCDELSETEKAEAHKLVISAFQHSDEVIPYDDEASLRTSTRSFAEDLYPLNTQTVLTTTPELSTSHQKGRVFDIAPCEYGSNKMGSTDVRFDEPMDFECQVAKTLICDPGSLNHLEYFGSSSPGDL